ncbi:peptide ABC transporter substrate-binding protein [Aerophototrophica crusticola]|uniref:Peptide ABC transporter substrate-binding protein n=1 Tax=Aerophototrophica crusticola TaxID=1709002 RepID=A0A858R3Y0_9PROT|nr:peptide ABC transporter substrate-binding protein [Rhodospirillaceae bacterium B3]
MGLALRRLALATLLSFGTATLAAAVPQPAAAEKVFRRGIGSGPGTIDPHKADVVSEAMVIYELFEGLMSLDAKGEPRYALAERHEMTADGLTYTFTLRANAKFSDGTPITAEDVVYSYRRLADPKTASPYGYFTWPIANGPEVNTGKKPLEQLGIEAVDPRTVRITLSQPAGYFLGQVSHQAMSVVQKASVEKHGQDWTRPGNLVGTGAYVLKETVPQSSFTMTRNPHYYDADQVKIDKVILYVTESTDTEFKQFRAGELEATYTTPLPQLGWVRQNMPDALKPTPLFATFYIAFNLQNEPWKSNPKLRQAMSLVIDRDVVAKKVMDPEVRPAVTFVPPNSVPGYASPIPAWAKQTQAERDAQARKLLAEAGYGPGGKPLPPVEVLYTTNENNRRILIAVAAMWKQKLGIEANLANQEGRVVAEIAQNRQFKDLLLFGWVGDYTDPNTFLKIMRSDVVLQNYPSFVSADYDRLLEEGNASLDPAARFAKLAQAEAIFLDSHAIMTAIHTTRFKLVSSKVKGWVPNPRDHYPTRYLDIAP